MTLRDPYERLLRIMPATRTQLREQSHISRSSVTRVIVAMHEAGWCHIGRWIKPEGSGPFLPVYHAGQGKDAVCRLVAQTNAESTRKSRIKAEKEGRRDMQRARANAVKRLKRLRKAGPQTWLSALIIQKGATK